MIWPLVSARAYELVLDERDRLRVQNDAYFEHLKRMDRLEHGVAELSPEKRKPAEPVMPEILMWISQHETQAVRDRLTRECNQAYKELGEWPLVWARIKEAEGAD
ncbi:MAG: hypothetical protein KAJ55_00275 [Anaerolineales bacterium]|nr:hypothetical protein [Anaerolineales bacterium]